MLDDDDHDACGCSTDPSEVEPPAELEPEREGPGFQVFRMLPRLEFSWGNVGTGSTLEYSSPRYVAITDAGDGQLVLRIHESSKPGGGYVEVFADLVGPSEDAPETMFVDAQPAVRLRVSADATPGTAMIGRMRLDMGSHLRLRLRCTRLGTSDLNRLVLSADLIARDAEPSECRCS